jgi:hypothetical protein
MLKFPPPKELQRINDYEIYEKIFFGEHYEAFNVATGGEFGQDLKKLDKLRYVAANFGGMISKLSADMLFEEFPKITMPDQDEFIDALIESNNLKTQFYESALENSYRGDAVFRIRGEEKQVIIEDLNPSIYFPEYDENNVRREPKAHNLAWRVGLGGTNPTSGKQRQGMFMEKHLKGSIKYHLYEIDGAGNVLGEITPIESYYPEIKPTEATNIKDFLVVHIPNFRVNSRFFGISDYKDLTSLFAAIENRVTKVDNILDKHGDPILAVPEGVLDEEGNVNRKSFGVIEVPTDGGSGQKPEYIVWDANLDSAFKEIDKLVEFLFMTSETSSAAFGLDKNGAAESGRALKYKLLRTIAKKHRKELYYDCGLKRLFKNACEFAKANSFMAGEVAWKGEVGKVQIEWQDGIINDALETLEVEEKKQSMGITSDVDIIMRTEGISKKEAEAKVKLIQEEKKANMPAFTVNPFNAKDPANMPPKKDMPPMDKPKK